jgi:hypothetical protein
LEFGDIVMAVATSIVIISLLVVPLDMVLFPLLGFDLLIVSRSVSVLIAGLIVGYIFAGKMAEARITSIGKILVLGSVIMIFVVLNLTTFGDWTVATKEAYQEANPGTTLSTAEWVTVENMAAFQVIFFNLVVLLVFGFIGLYVGSILRKSSKS